MKKGDFVLIDFVGRVKDTGEIFDLTREEVAKKENVYNEKISYQPATIIVGAGLALKGLEEAVANMKVGEKKRFDLPPAKGFGERKGELLRVIPLSAFREQNVNPTPGSYVTINNLNGRVISVDGGRIRVDFNHPLAGKMLEYEIEVKGERKEPTARLKSVVNYFTGVDEKEVEVAVKGIEAEISFKKRLDLPAKAKEKVALIAIKWVGGLEKIKFVDVYTK